jgi:uncharacterized delta-60 repeat protein
VASIVVPGSTQVNVTDIATRSNDAAVVVGYETPTSGRAKFVVARFRADGEPDLRFSDDGVNRVGFPQGDAYGYGVAIQPDRKIVVVGEVDPTSNSSNPAILRLNADGTLDKTFAKGGRKVVASNPSSGRLGPRRQHRHGARSSPISLGHRSRAGRVVVTTPRLAGSTWAGMRDQWSGCIPDSRSVAGTRGGNP